MIKPLRLHVQNLRPLEAGPLAPHLASFAALLAQQRYCRVTGWNKLRLVAALSNWMVQTKLRLKDLNERRVAKFLGWRLACQNEQHDYATLGGKKFKAAKWTRFRFS